MSSRNVDGPNAGGAAALAEPPPSPAAPVTDEALLGSVAAAMALVKAHRTHGHLAARLDPLGSEPPGETLLDALPALREVYCGTIAYELELITDHGERVWLREAIESGRYRQPLA